MIRLAPSRRVPIFVLTMWLSPLSLLAADPVIIGSGDALQEAADRAGRSEARRLQLRAGTYRLPEPLKLGPAHAGLTVEALPGADVRIVGSQPLAVARPAENHPGLWEAALPPPPKDGWRFRRVFHNGQSLARARTPNTGWLEVKEKLPVEGPFVMTVTPDLLKEDWGTRGSVMLCAVQKWAGFEMPIKAVDVAKHQVTLPLHPIAHRQEEKNRFWIENAVEAIDRPGEWAVDIQKNRLLWQPLEGQTADAPSIAVPTLTHLVQLDGCRAVTLRGLTFAECGDDFPVTGEIDAQAAANRRGALRLVNAQECTIDGCVVEYVGGYGIDIGQGSRGNRVLKSKLRHLGAGGVRIGETVVAKEPERQVVGNVVEDCEVHHYGGLDYGAVGLIVFQASETRLSHNEVHHAPYTGVSVGWTWDYRASPCHHNTIEFNHLHDLGSDLLSDLGGVYLLGPQEGTVVRNNWVHDLHCHAYGGWGLYTDEGSSNIVLENNVVARCQTAGFHQHYGRDNVVRNNLIVHCGEGGVRRSREEAHNSFTFEGNVVVNETPQLLHSNWSNGNFVTRKNLYFSPASATLTFGGKSWDDWRKGGRDEGSLIVDPRLVDPAHPERGLHADSTATRIGFTMPDLSEVGPRKAAGR